MTSEPVQPPLTTERRLGRDHEVRAITTTFLKVRPFIVAPYLVIQWILIAASGAAQSQLIVVGAANVVFIVLFLNEARHARLGFVTADGIFRSCSFTLIAIAFAVVGTGAMASPMVPLLFAPVGVTFAAFGRTRQSVIILGLLLVIGIVLPLTTPHVQPLVVASPYREATTALAIVGTAVLLYFGVASLTAAHRRAADALAIQGDDALRATSVRIREWESHGAQIAHELKNPLAAIQSLIEVMAETTDSRNVKRLSVVSSELQRLNLIIDGYRSLALAAPFQSIARTEVNIDALLEGLVMILDARAAQSGVVLTFDSSPGAGSEHPLSVFLDRDRVKESLINLIQNALQACSSGGTIRLSRSIREGQLVIRVVDSGRGMPLDVLDKIGTPYFSLRQGGTGLGVALVRQVAEQHGGTLKYESSPGHGTTAILELPLHGPGKDA